jgi:hypothetical protein
MKFTFWDQLVLNLTGRLPKRTQAEVDDLIALKEMIARVNDLEHRSRVLAAEKRKVAKATSDTPKPTKPKTTRKKKGE